MSFTTTLFDNTEQDARIRERRFCPATPDRRVDVISTEDKEVVSVELGYTKHGLQHGSLLRVLSCLIDLFQFVELDQMVEGKHP